MPKPPTPQRGRLTTGILPGAPTPEGDGMLVYRPIPSKAVREIDPFLLLDRLGPIDIPAGGHGGVPPHPHAGFEVVSYVLQGSLEHLDSTGNRGRIGPGDVQWMTAGSGLIHSETPGEALRASGGTLEAIQLWVNLPARLKHIAPRYGDIPAGTIPSATSPDGLASVKVISGEALGVRATLPLQTPITYQRWTLRPGATVHQQLPTDACVLAYVLDGEARFGADGRRAVRDELVRFEPTGPEVSMSVPTGGAAAELLLLAAVPTGEPVARSGPFVMSTMQEIRDVIARYRGGELGEIEGE